MFCYVYTQYEMQGIHDVFFHFYKGALSCMDGSISVVCDALVYMYDYNGMQR